MKSRKFLSSVIASVLIGSVGGGATIFSERAQASHHFETNLSRMYPAFDLTDLYIFESPRAGHTVLILDANPTTGQDGVAGFGEDGLYNIHIAADRGLAAGLTFTFRYSNGSLIVGKLNEANPALGVEGSRLGVATVGKTSALANGIKIWAGAARDPFVGNSAGIQDFRKALEAGRFDTSTFDNGVDLFASLNTSAIILEVPNRLLPPSVYVYATSAVQHNGQWQQVNRWGNVLTTHLFLMGDETLASDYSAHRPDDDKQRTLPISGFVLRAVTLAGSQANPVAYADSVAARFNPDMIPYKIGSKAHYGVDKFNGRSLKDDAMDIVLSLFSGKTVTDKANTLDRWQATFPFVIPITGQESKKQTK